MNGKSIIAAVAALSMLGSSGLAYADDHDDHHDNGRHVGEQRRDEHPHWRRGDRLPTEYRGHVVDDWRGRHLSAPPRGYHWVEANGDYVLVAIASGVIASILLNH